MNLEEKAIQLAVQYHAGQKDLSGNLYIFHLLRVMMKMNTPEEKAVGVLHDIIEDTFVNSTSLASFGIPWEVVDSVTLLTKDKQISYEDYISQIIFSDDKIAMKVKLADLEDNLNVLRLQSVDEKSMHRINKYLIARKRILENL